MNRAGWLAAGSIVGALAAPATPEPLMVALMASLACLALVIVARRNAIALARHRTSAVAVLAGLALVLLRLFIGVVLAAPADPEQAETEFGGTAHQAVLISVGTPSGGLQRATVELRPPESADRVYAWLPRYPPVVIGDVIRFTGSLEPASTEGGFGEFLARSGIEWTTRVRSLERVGGDGSPVAALEGIRRQVAEMITRALPEPQAGLAAAMMIGLRDLVARDVAADFRASGLSHVVAISGWHICLLAAVVSATLGGLPRRQRSLVVLAAICSYSILAGASPSILRAAVMASVVLLARESGRAGQAPTALALTCFGLIVFEPMTVTDIGFQLSVAATAGLLVWSRGLGEWLGVRLPRRAPRWFLEALAVSLAAQAATLPLIFYHFATLSLVAPLANLLVAPLVAPAMLLTVVALAAGGLIGLGMPALLFAPLTLVGAVGIGAMIGVAHTTAALPFATLTIPEPLNVLAAAGSVGLMTFVIRRQSKPKSRRQTLEISTTRTEAKPGDPSPHRWALGGGTVSLCLLLVLIHGARPDGRLHVTVLDIGQGDAILLQGPNGGRMLIDTGPDPDRLLTLLDQRLPAWDRRIDLVVLTHPHEDHVAGLALLLDRYRIGDVVEPGMVGLGPGDAAYRRRMTELGRESRVVAAGDRLALDGIVLNVEWPFRGRVPLRATDSGTQINNVSIVLDLTFGQRRMLFSGDVEEEIDPQLLAAGIAEDLSGQLDVLKVAHHGSRTATTDVFVEQLRPRVAVISAGWGNPYGHPSPETVGRLVGNGARLFRTDVDGSVEISTNGEDLVAQAGGGRPKPTDPPAQKPLGIGFCPIPTEIRARRRPPYNRPHGHPDAHRSGSDHACAEAEGRTAHPLCRGRRDCRVPLRCHDPPGSGRQRTARRNRRPAA